ncbi:MAG: FkbM family methyltransferase [Vicinamibacterales bacterium]
MSQVPAPTTIYDFGCNNGDNIPYYLQKAERVVAVEANPTLATNVRQRFSTEIASGRVIVENCVLAPSPAGPVEFYIHKWNSVLSQFPRPKDAYIAEFEKVVLPSKRPSDIILAFGQPLYVKVDIEHSEQVVLEEVFNRSLRPPYISAESHDVEVFATMVALGKYSAFKLVDGASVSIRFRNHIINGRTGDVPYSFPVHSAGPFGTDLPGPWLSAQDFFYQLAHSGLGWKDIHATNTVQPESTLRDEQALQHVPFSRLAREVLPSFVRALKRRLQR